MAVLFLLNYNEIEEVCLSGQKAPWKSWKGARQGEQGQGETTELV